MFLLWIRETCVVFILFGFQSVYSGRFIKPTVLYHSRVCSQLTWCFFFMIQGRGPRKWGSLRGGRRGYLLLPDVFWFCLQIPCYALSGFSRIQPTTPLPGFISATSWYWNSVPYRLQWLRRSGHGVDKREYSFYPLVSFSTQCLLYSQFSIKPSCLFQLCFIIFISLSVSSMNTTGNQNKQQQFKTILDS